MIKNYFKTAWKNLLRNKVYSFINIAGLSIGLACCMLILLYNNDEVSYDRFHDNAKNIYRVVHTDYGPDGKQTGANGITGTMPGPVFKREIPEVESYVRVQGEQFPVKIGTQIFEQPALMVDSNFLSVFSFPLKEGNKNTALKDLYSVVLAEDVAKKFFGTADAIGKTLEMPIGGSNGGPNGTAFKSFVVSGILPKSPQNSSIKIDMLLNMKLTLNNGGDMEWLNFFLNTFVVLNPHADVKAVEAKMKKVYEKDAKDQLQKAKELYNDNTVWNYSLQPLLAMHLSENYGPDNGLEGGSKPIYTKILGGIALFMLVIACINFVNLTVARSLKRAKEIGVRKVIGGERRQLIAQFLGESFLLSFFSFVLAILLVFLVLPVFNSLSNKALAFSYLLNAKLIAGYIALFIITSLLAGFYPALVLSGFNPVQTLYNRMPLSGKNYLSKGLVVLQFTLTTFLIVATITVYTQFKYLTSFNLGYNDKNLVVVETNQLTTTKLNTFRHELMKDPSVTAVAARQRGQWGTVAKADDKQMNFAIDVIDSAYLPVLQIPIAMGRNFSGAYTSDSTTAVLVNESFMKEAGWKDLNNRKVDFFYDSIKYNVVGVVKDYHYSSLLEKIGPQLFTMHPKYGYAQLLIKIKPEHSSATLQHIEKVVKAQQPLLPYKYEFKDAKNEKQYEAESKWKQIITFAAILTIFISCIGLFGLATLAAEKRVKEIGIRKVLGASVGNIATMLSNNFLKLVLVAAFIAFPLAWWAMNKWLENYPYRVNMNAWMFIAAIVVVSAIALFTVSFQAIRAAIANPVKSLRSE
ncbi:MAG: ABC transporter permease [Ferruginibacter sp.]